MIVTPMTLEGSTLGKYRVMEPLGRGGMAQVYRGYHPQLDRYVAIKILRAELVEDEEFLGRFRREAQAIANLRHPNIVQIFDFDIQDELYFMVMELLEGDTLKAYLNRYRTRNTRMPYDEMVRILLDVLAGLSYAHSENIVHRDIKPANVLLSKRGQAVVTDFGIAQIIGGTQYTASGALIGTLNYMSPEQGMKGTADNRSDLYAVGIMLYEMLTGHTPYDADTPLAVLMKHVNDPLPLPRKVDPAIPEAFERVVLKALAKDPNDRYQAAEEMAQALQRAAAETGVEPPEKLNIRPAREPRAGAGETSTPPTTAGAGVFSGTRRERLADVQFAEGDTVQGTENKPGSERNFFDFKFDEKAFESAAENFGLNLANNIVNDVMGSLDRGLASPSGFPAVAWAGVKMVGLLVGGNLLMLFIAGLMGNWSVFTYGWPVEFLLLGIGLGFIMSALELIWVVIPVGFLVGNAALLSYLSVSERWGDFLLLWPLEVLLVFVVIFYPVRMSILEPKRMPEAARKLSQGLIATGIGWFVVATGVAVLVKNFL